MTATCHDQLPARLLCACLCTGEEGPILERFCLSDIAMSPVDLPGWYRKASTDSYLRTPQSSTPIALS